MYLFRNSLAIALFAWCSIVNAQSILISDSALANALCLEVPTVLNDACTELDTTKALVETLSGTSRLILADEGINNADEVIYFGRVDTLYLNKNSLTSFPKDLSRFNSLNFFNIARNELTELPDLTYQKGDGDLHTIRLFFGHNNKVTMLPDSWYAPNSRTLIIDIYDNNLRSLPDFNAYTQLKRLNVSNNKLDFEDFIPLLSHPKWDESLFIFFPQKEFRLDLNFQEAEIGETLKIDASQDPTSNTYYLNNESGIIDSNTTGEFEVFLGDESNFGDYWVEIRNSNFPDPTHVLSSRKYEITLKIPEVSNPVQEIENTSVNELYVFSPDGDGQFDEFYIDGKDGEEINIYNKTGEVVLKEKAPFLWTGVTKDGEVANSGLYVVRVGETRYKKVLIAF